MNDPMAIQLYQTAMKSVVDSETYEKSSKSKLSAFRSICGILENQFVKVTSCILTDPKCAAKYAKNGQAYCAHLKRKYEDIATDDS
ncbi:uncharacterized protein RHIMIDRAFT_277829 [Rhizopus microsporus ATCC 52813]|uniref:Uncharacterized protein n=1 Tax=Rhizopus microsporus ATCC 52813 TaxID=1340429 RepID=A0A2G4SZ00_RHIZD|nr:uncharacterized protein RHIMIDRAFT_277829 [Rhizopus microsporus ATCC 52813]PHZ13975.1 hypothetical protein RHIMIDRAFT_277829 [Rhizopus microsporus ATCC 52813]